MKKFQTNIKREQPYKCILCNSIDEDFTTIEHIVPHSMGNYFLTLGKGWVCDKCNNICSAFESRALYHSSLSFQKVLMGNTTKKGKLPKAKYESIEWNKEDGGNKNSFYVDLNERILKRHPSFNCEVGETTTLMFPAYSKYDTDICKLLLKIGIETSCALFLENPSALDSAKEFILNKNDTSWPYLLIQDKGYELKSPFSFSNLIYSHILASSFDIFVLKSDNDEIIFFFSYGHFLYAINLFSRELDWLMELENEGFKFLVFPKEFIISSN